MKKFLLLLLVIVCFAALMLTACEAQPDPQIDDENTPIDATANTLTLGMIGTDIKTACIIVADALGYYEEEDVDVKFEKISNLSDGATALDMGKLDVLPFGVIPSATFIAGGTDLVVFGGTISEGSEIIVTPENAGTINTLEDFRGKTIGCYRMETGHMVMKGLLREAGMVIDEDVTFVLLDSQQTIIEAVRKGEVDLGFLNSGQGYIAQQAGLVVEKQVGEFEADFPCCRQTTSRAAYENKYDALVKFEIANLRAYETIMTDKQAAIDALVAYSGQDATYVEAIIYGIEGEYDAAMIISLDPNKNKVIDFYETMKANGDIDPDTEFAMEDHIDITIYKAALDELITRDADKQIYSDLLAEYEVNNL